MKRKVRRVQFKRPVCWNIKGGGEMEKSLGNMRIGRYMEEGKITDYKYM